MSHQPDSGSDFTATVNRAGELDGDAVADLVESKYSELREIARQLMVRERNDHTLQPTALVHEAYVRLLDQSRVTAEGTTFFKACFARRCRHVLVDEARARNADRRGGGEKPQQLVETAADLGAQAGTDLIDLHDAVEALGGLNERMARIVDLRVFAGLGVEECADALGVSRWTVRRDWDFARNWLKKELG